ncbi:MAG: type II secretion system F family protein [Myxococcota bacterium]
MENLVLIVTVVSVFAAFLLFSQFLYWTLQSKQANQQRELARRLGTLVEKSAGPNLIKGPANTGARGIEAQLEDLLRQAGSPFPLQTLYQRMAIFGVVGIVLGVVAFRGALGLLGIAIAYVPVMLVSGQAQARAAKLAEQLPDGLDLLARSLQAGHGISEAMRSVAEELPIPLAQEFGRVYEEHNLGRDFRECLQNLCKRNPGSFDLQIFVSSVLLQRDTGGNLVEILNNISGTIRQRFVFRGKVAALTSEARFTAYILGGLPFAIGSIIAVMQPNYLTPLFVDPLGNLMVAGGLCSFSMGVFLMREASKVEI